LQLSSPDVGLKNGVGMSVAVTVNVLVGCGVSVGVGGGVLTAAVCVKAALSV
jgi:hypothetical protein